MDTDVDKCSDYMDNNYMDNNDDQGIYASLLDGWKSCKEHAVL